MAADEHRRLVESMVRTMRRQIALNLACAHKSANGLEKITLDEISELHSAKSACDAAHLELIQHLERKL